MSDKIFSTERHELESYISDFFNSRSSFFAGIHVLMIDGLWEIQPVINGSVKDNPFNEPTKQMEIFTATVRKFTEKYKDRIKGFQILRLYNRWTVWVTPL